MIAVEARPAADLLWHVLAHLPLGADAASLHDPALPARAWALPLTGLYLQSPGRLWAHWAPLWAPYAPELPVAPQIVEALLRAFRPLQDEAGAALRAGLCEAVQDVAPSHARWWTQAGDLTALGATASSITGPIARVRAALWAPAKPPPLRVLHAPSLRHHARAATVQGARVVATSLLEPPAHVVCQVLHEETHPVSDRSVPPAPRDTRAGTPGHAHHLLLERAAVARTEVAVRAAAPELLPAFEAWRRRNPC